MGRIQVRQLSCYCEACILLDYENCSNKEYVDNMEVVTFLKNPSVLMGAGQVDQPEESEENFTMESLICKGSVVAVRPNV